MKNTMRRIALFLAAALCVSCLFAGMAMADEAKAPAEGESSGASLEQLFASLGESAQGENAGESADSAAGESEGESPELSEEDQAAMEQAFTEMMESLGLTEMMEYDWQGHQAELDAMAENGEEITLETAMPEVLFTFLKNMMSPENSEEATGMTLDCGAKENDMFWRYTFIEEVPEDVCEEIAAKTAESFESDETKAELKNGMEKMADGFHIDIDKISMSLGFYNNDGSAIYEKTFTYEDLADVEVPAAEEAPAAEEVVEEEVAE